MTRVWRMGVALLCVLAAARATTPPTRAVPKRQAGGTQLSDAELEKAIRERFARSKIATNGFSVRVQGGVAILEGGPTSCSTKEPRRGWPRLRVRAKGDQPDRGQRTGPPESLAEPRPRPAARADQAEREQPAERTALKLFSVPLVS
jgi:hypothetical protein